MVKRRSTAGRTFVGVVTGLVMLALAGFGVVARAQTLSSYTLAQLGRFVQLDDMLLDVDLYEWSGSPGTGWQLKAKQGAPVDTSQVDRFLAADNRTFGGWDFGVMPVEFDTAISAQRRAMFMRNCETWGQTAPILCIERTSQLGFLRVEAANEVGGASPCFSSVGQPIRLVSRILNLGDACWNERNVAHEQGHALGFWHEQQRPDRDGYLTIDLSNVAENARGNFNTIGLQDPLGPYDFLSVMHYRNNAFAIDPARPVMIPREGYQSYAGSMGTAASPSGLDHEAMARLYGAAMRPLAVSTPLQSTRTRFDRNDFLDAMERLHAFYYSRMGLNRDGGLSIGGRPDFLGIATWIFDVYLAARSRGFTREQSMQIVVADITRTDEWRGKHPGQGSLTRPGFTPVISFDRGEFLDVLNRLDAFYRAPEGLQRPDGLSIRGGPDFLGIAAWLFDVYLNERLSGGSPNVAWIKMTDAIRATDEWRQKH